MFGENLRRIREEQNISVYELATRCHLPAPTIHNIEAGADPQVETAKRIAAALGVTLDDLAGPLPDLPPPTPRRRVGRPRKVQG